MNKKMLALIPVMLVAVFALSAFSWSFDHDPAHTGKVAYQLSERADYSAFFTTQLGMDLYHQSEWNAAAMSSQRGLAADSARYTAMAAYYQAKAEAAAMSTQRGLAADSARYTAMAAYYQAKAEAAAMSTQRGLAADSARYTAMAAYYLAKAEAAAVELQYGPPGR
jgi:hypothetical protein